MNKQAARTRGTAPVALVLFAVSFLLVPAAVLPADPAELLPAGEAAPAFTSVDIDNKPFSLEEELARGPVFLIFWSIF